MKNLKLTNPRTGQVLSEEEFLALSEENKSKFLTDINWYKRLLGKYESYIKDYIKKSVELNEDSNEAMFGNHKVSLVSRSYFDKKAMTDEDRATYEKLERKYSKRRTYTVIK